MEEVNEAAVFFARNSFIIFAGRFISYIILGFGSIWVARLLSPADYGLYTISLILPSFFLLFTDIGIDSSIMTFLPKYKSDNKLVEINRVYRVALLTKFVLSFILTLILFTFAEFLSSYVLKRPELSSYIRTSSFLLLFNSVYITIISIFTGLERMDLRSYTNISEAIIKGTLSPLLVYYGLGINGAIIGYLVSNIVASFFGGYFLYKSLPYLSKIKIEEYFIKDDLMMMIKYGLPVSLRGILISFVYKYQEYLLSIYVTNESLGNYQAALNLFLLISLITDSILVTLIPTFSRINYLSEFQKFKEAFSLTIRYSTIFIIPIIFSFILISDPVSRILYTMKYSDVPLYLTLKLLPMLLVGFGTLSVYTFFISQGYTMISLRIGVITAILNIILNPIFIIKWDISGLIWSSTIIGIIVTIYNNYIIYNDFHLKIDIWYAFKTILSSLLTFFIIRSTSFIFLTSNNFLNILFYSISFLLLYLIIAPFTGIINEKDINNINNMSKGVIVISFLIGVLLMLEEKILLFKKNASF